MKSLTNINFYDYLCIIFKNLIHPIIVIQRYHRAYQNFFFVYRKNLRKDYPIKAILKNGQSIILFNRFQTTLASFEVIDKISFQEKLLLIDHKGLHKIQLFDWEENGDAYGVFFAEDYKWLPTNDRIVVDIGANIGDSSIYFALHGAKKIVGLEPSLKNFQAAKKNIIQNALTNQIEIILAGCSNDKHQMKINTDEGGVAFGLKKEKENNSMLIPTMTLNDILQSRNLQNPVLKMDCEGCEYEVILSTSKSTLRQFTHIQLEYHFGYKNLKTKLEQCGFKVIVSRPNCFGLRNFLTLKYFVGFLYAEKI